MKDKRQNFMQGVVNGAERFSRLFCLESDKKKYIDNDFDALKSDWEQIGQDMYEALDEFEQTLTDER